MIEPKLHHPRLSTIFQGLQHPISSPDNEIWQFRGIKYANIPARFRQSTPHETFPATYNATEYGLKCPQHIFPLRLEDNLIGLPPNVASHAPNVFDEFNCLNLNITIPSSAKEGDDLPVMVYIHGGGGFSGANSDWWCDGGSIVKRSLEVGRPVIMVAINYRLTVFGNMGSEELGDVNGKDNTANFAQRDIYTALSWIHTHITPFGGSPSKITAYGESYGSEAIGTQIHASPAFPPVFSRAIMQSETLGMPIFSIPLTLSAATSVYTATKDALKITSPQELQNVPWKDLLTAYEKSDPRNGISHVAVIDNIAFSEKWKENLSPNFGNTGGNLLLGSTGKEVAVVKMVLSNTPVTDPRPVTTSLITTLSSIISASKASSILSAYGVDETTNPEDVAERLLQIVEDICFYRDQELFSTRAKTAGVKVQEYSFEQFQPFTGPFKGLAGHSLDLAYLHGHPTIFDSCQDPEKERKMQKALQDAWIGFANGEEKWNGEVVRKFGPAAEVEDLGKERFLGEVRRGGKWGVWEGIEYAVLEGVVGVIVGHVAGLIGTG